MELAYKNALIAGGTAGIDGSVRFVQADLADVDSVKSLVQQEFGSFEKTFDANVRGSYFLTAEFASPRSSFITGTLHADGGGSAI